MNLILLPIFTINRLVIILIKGENKGVDVRRKQIISKKMVKFYEISTSILLLQLIDDVCQPARMSTVKWAV
jgi:hypothetical protein